MSHTSSQTFLRELDKKLWTVAGKHAVLGLIFLNYVPDSFAQRQADIEAMLEDPENDFFVHPAENDKRGGGLHPPSPNKSKKYFTNSTYGEPVHREPEERDYHIEKNAYWVPALARWKTSQDCHSRMRSCKMPSHPAERPRSRGYSAKLPAEAEILKERGRLAHSYKITSTDKLIDNALESVEKENVNGAERHRFSARGARRVRAGARIKLKNVLNKNYTQLQIDPADLAGLIDLIATIPFQHADLHSKDILGHVSLPRSIEWNEIDGAKRCPKGAAGGRHQFAQAEGRKGGHWSGTTKTSPQGSPKGWRGGANQYFTPKSIVSLIVEMIEPYQGRVYDPAMGSGGFFVQSERFIEEHGGTIGDIMVFGQDQWAWGTHLRRAQRARRVRLRRKQPNQSNPTTWRLAAMNMAIRGIDFDFGKKPADTFTRDQHPDLRARPKRSSCHFLKTAYC